MNLQQLIKPDNVLCNVEARSKKHCLEILSELLARANPDVAVEEVFSRLVERERLGCTSLDNGIAFPHCRMSGIQSVSAALMKLATPLEFDAPDDEPVDLVFGLMVPDELDESHYFTIDEITAILADERLRARLRTADSDKALYDALRTERNDAAAKLRSARNG